MDKHYIYVPVDEFTDNGGKLTVDREIFTSDFKLKGYVGYDEIGDCFYINPIDKSNFSRMPFWDDDYIKISCTPIYQ